MTSPTTETKFPGVPNYYPDHPSLLKQIIKVVQNLLQGRSNNAHAVTLTANVGTTTVTLAKDEIGQATLVFFMPQTANAAAEIGAGTMYVSARNVLSNTFTITHANNAQTDRTFGFALIG